MIESVKCDINDQEFVYKFSSGDLRMGIKFLFYPPKHF